MLKSSIANLKSAPNMKWIYVNFSSIHQRFRTELWVAITLGLWAAATTLHVIQNYGKENETTVEIIQILVASVFAAGFGWHLHKCIILHRMEKRGESYSSSEEFGEVEL